MPRTYTLRIRGEADGHYRLSADPGAYALTGADVGLTYNAEAGVAIAFSSDWGTATGTGSTAVGDGGTWPSVDPGCGSTAVETLREVVEGSGVGWTRTANVFRITQRGESVCGGVYVTNIVPESTDYWVRFYMRNGGDQTGQRHWISSPASGDLDLSWGRTGLAGGWSFSDHRYPPLFYAGASGSDPRDALSYDAWYRIEYKIEFQDANRTRRFVRIYNASGDLMFDNGDGYTEMVAADSPHTTSMYDYQVANPDHYYLDSPANSRHLFVGNPGPGGSTDTGEHVYIADLAVSTEGWIEDQVVDS